MRIKDRIKPEEVSRKLRDLAELGIVNHDKDTQLLKLAADLIDDMDERIAIMVEDMYKSTDIRFP